MASMHMTVTVLSYSEAVVMGYIASKQTYKMPPINQSTWPTIDNYAKDGEPGVV